MKSDCRQHIKSRNLQIHITWQHMDVENPLLAAAAALLLSCLSKVQIFLHQPKTKRMQWWDLPTGRQCRVLSGVCVLGVSTINQYREETQIFKCNFPVHWHLKVLLELEVNKKLPKAVAILYIGISQLFILHQWAIYRWKSRQTCLGQETLK